MRPQIFSANYYKGEFIFVKIDFGFYHKPGQFFYRGEQWEIVSVLFNNQFIIKSKNGNEFIFDENELLKYFYIKN